MMLSKNLTSGENEVRLGENEVRLDKNQIPNSKTYLIQFQLLILD